MIGWLLAIHKRQYNSWWHYPIFHWYDLLGCIPVGSFRFLRVLRLISITVRLQRLGVIDISDTALFQFLKRYYGIFVEEVSDRVVVNVLEGVQEEIQHGSPTQEKLVRDILQPRHELLAREVVSRTGQGAQRLLLEHRDSVRHYIHRVITEAMRNNPELKMLGVVPVLGGVVNRQLDHAVGNIVANVVEQMIADLSSDTVYALAENTLGVALDEMLKPSDSELDPLQLVHEIVELMKEQVQVQRWKQAEQG